MAKATHGEYALWLSTYNGGNDIQAKKGNGFEGENGTLFKSEYQAIANIAIAHLARLYEASTPVVPFNDFVNYVRLNKDLVSDVLSLAEHLDTVDAEIKREKDK